MNETLLDRIRPVTRRLRSVRFWRSLSDHLLWCGMRGLIQQQMNADQGHSTQLGRVLLANVTGVSVVAFLLSRFSFRNPRAVAMQIEQHFPSLDQRLLTALSQNEKELVFCGNAWSVRRGIIRGSIVGPKRCQRICRLEPAFGTQCHIAVYGACAWIVVPQSGHGAVSAAANPVDAAREMKVQPGMPRLNVGPVSLSRPRLKDWFPNTLRCGVSSTGVMCKK